jgi:hypothetical protein
MNTLTFSVLQSALINNGMPKAFRLNVAHAPYLYIKEDNVKTVFCRHLIYRQIFCYFGMHGTKNA